MKTYKWEGSVSTQTLQDVGSPDNPTRPVRHTFTGIYSEELWRAPAGGGRIVGTSGDDLIFLDIIALRGQRLINFRAFDLGAGDDILDLTSQRYGYGATIAVGGTGNDWLLGNSGKDRFDGDNGKDRLKGYGNEDVLNGGAGDDYLDGGAKNDKLYGGDGQDSLVDTNFGRDQLHGGAGADELMGGKDGDRLTGGSGADRFLFLAATDSEASGSGRDKIMDFSRREKDIIHLKAVDADKTAHGNHAFDFIGTDKFSKEAGELRFQKHGANTLISADRNGDGKADFAILVAGHIDFKEGDFIL